MFTKNVFPYELIGHQLMDMSKIFEFAPIAQFAIDKNKRVTHWNIACELLTGYAASEMVGTTNQWRPFYAHKRPMLADVVLDNDFDEVRYHYRDGAVRQSAINPFSLEGTGFYNRLGGKPRHLYFSAAPIRNSEGLIIGAIEIFRDITHQIQTEERLSASEECFGFLSEMIVNGVSVVQDGKICFINSIGVKLFGYSDPKDLLGKEVFSALISSTHRQAYSDNLTAVKEGGPHEKIFPVSCVRADGSQFRLDLAHNLIQWKNRAAVLVCMQEAKERRQRKHADVATKSYTEYKSNKLKSMIKDRHGLGRLIGNSEPIQQVYDQILKASSSDVNVLIFGESGTGKDLVARTIHEMSDRDGNDFIAVNCGAIPENLIESEFFGYKKGAFTGAVFNKCGFLEAADGGTLLLDEVGDISLNMQVKLLRAIDGGGFTPIGDRRAITPNVRIISATNKDLKELVASGLMREDFFYRILIISIEVPPLRERKDDIPLLVYHFLQSYKKNGKTPILPERILNAMIEYHWPGNIRELQNTLHRYVTIGALDFLDVSNDPNNKLPAPQSSGNQFSLDSMGTVDLRTALKNFEKSVISKALAKNKGNRTHTAKSLGIDRKSLQRKIKKLSI